MIVMTILLGVANFGFYTKDLDGQVIINLVFSQQLFKILICTY